MKSVKEKQSLSLVYFLRVVATYMHHKLIILHQRKSKGNNGLIDLL